MLHLSAEVSVVLEPVAAAGRVHSTVVGVARLAGSRLRQVPVFGYQIQSSLLVHQRIFPNLRTLRSLSPRPTCRSWVPSSLGALVPNNSAQRC